MWRASAKDTEVCDTDKKDNSQQDSGLVDSGCISSGNLQVCSSEISDDLLDPLSQTTNEDSEEPVKEQNIQMKVDSGVDLGISESLSQMNLSHTSISGEKQQQQHQQTQNVQPEPVLEPVVSMAAVDKTLQSDATIDPWQIYYVQDEDGDTQLHIAIIQGFLEAAAICLIRLAPHPCLLDILNDDGQAPLHLAVLTQQPRIVRHLILAGADPALRDRQGNTALHLACAAGDLASAQALTNPLTAYERNFLGPLKRIPALPQNLEQRNYRGEMCIHIAAAADKMELVRLLLRLGADLEAKEGLSGKTALHLAIELRCSAVLAFLLQECRPYLDATTYGGITPYQTALCLDYQLAKDLVRLGATPEPLPESESDDSSDDESSPIISEISRLSQHVGVSASS